MHHITRPLVLALFLLLFAACSSPGEGPLQQGTITLVVAGLPQNIAANVTVSGPGGFSQTATGSTTIPNLTPGSYTISASPVTVGDVTYQPAPPNQNLDVTSNATATATVTYSESDPPPGPGAVNLDFVGVVPNTIASTGFTLAQGGSQFLSESNLSLDTGAGTLTINAQPGLQFQGTNNLQNGLGVTVDATVQAKVIETTFLKPAFPGVNGNNANQQAGLWYGQPGNQDNYVKLVVISTSADDSTSAIELRREINGETEETPDGLRRSNSLSIPTGATVTLRLFVQPSGLATGFYSINGGPFQQVSTGGVALSSTAQTTGLVGGTFQLLSLSNLSTITPSLPPPGPAPIPPGPIPPGPIPPIPPGPIPPGPIPPIPPVPPLPPDPDPPPPDPLPPLPPPFPPDPTPPDPTPPDPTPPTPPDPTPPDPTPPTPPDPTPPMPPDPTPPDPTPPTEPPVTPPPAQPTPTFNLVTPESAAGIMASRRGDTSGSLQVVFSSFRVSNASD